MLQVLNDPLKTLLDLISFSPRYNILLGAILKHSQKAGLTEEAGALEQVQGVKFKDGLWKKICAVDIIVV